MRQARAQQDELDAEDQPEGAIAQVLHLRLAMSESVLFTSCQQQL